MTEREKIALLMQQMRNLYEQVAALLETADGLLDEAGWKPTNSTAITGSNAVYSPSDWFAQEAHRFYRHHEPANAHLLGFIVVLLRDRELDQDIEPLVSAGRLDYGEGAAVKDNYWYWYSRLHLRMPGRRDDGQCVEALAGEWPKWKLPFQKATTFGLPLVSVCGTEDLRSKVTMPLLNLMQP